ncbi:hypothetical protein CDAR_202131 [Caerostris darwini]|uniref:Uncharacterized protein n=1 Tax=Caerostris darwini TaxID=1538125 RepID=A0AAV4RIX6_9ARAC|nr:hypothetical protein CDAR_202131 [Caerostris darwini]
MPTSGLNLPTHPPPPSTQHPRAPEMTFLGAPSPQSAQKKKKKDGKKETVYHPHFGTSLCCLVRCGGESGRSPTPFKQSESGGGSKGKFLHLEILK